MTKLDKTQFEFFGGYLNYHGDYEGAEYYEEGNCHPSRVGTRKPLFIARFKHGGPFTKSKVMKKIVDMFTVEQYAEMMKIGNTPLNIIKQFDPAWFNKTLYGK